MLNVSNFSNLNQNYNIANKNNKKNQVSYTKTISGDVCFKGKIIKNATGSKNIIEKIASLLGLSAKTTAATTAAVATAAAATTALNSSSAVETVSQTDNVPTIDLEEWNSSCEGYKALQEAGFSDELIDMTLENMEKEEAGILKKGLNTNYIVHSNETIKEIYERFNKDLNNESESALLTFRLLSQAFGRSRSKGIYLNAVNAAVEIYGKNVFEKGTLDNGGMFGDNFAFVDENGHNIAIRVQERIDSDGNKIVENINSQGKVENKGKKYSPDGKLLEEWRENERTEYFYDKNGILYKKIKYYRGFNNSTETLTLVNGEWKSDKEGAWSDW